MLFAWGSSIYYVNKKTGWVGLENGQFCSFSICKVFIILGGWVTKSPKLCWRNIWMVPCVISNHSTAVDCFPPELYHHKLYVLHIFYNFRNHLIKSFGNLLKASKKILISDFDLWAVVHGQFQRSVCILLKLNLQSFCCIFDFGHKGFEI